MNIYFVFPSLPSSQKLESPGIPGRFSVKVGVILSALGLGFTVLTWWDADSVYHGVILLSLGGGFLLAAAISHRLSTKWGLLSSQEEAAREQRSPT